ncbi:SAM-dependent methyltransferase [Nonomuraea sp. 3N208]|uniref:SAM-dependent methyltransferase n=1 Tax=Nonomuraea sp. 3N208 TaxID=3457421 RepID=UPI003FCD50A2
MNAAWLLAMVAGLDLAAPLDPHRGRALAARGLAVLQDDRYVAAPGLTELLADPDQARFLNLTGNLRQAATAATGAAGWHNNDDDTLLEQGKASVSGIRLGTRHTLSLLGGLTERLAEPGAELLDVGVGTGGMISALCADLPALRGTGIDVLPRALDLAKRMVADFGVAERVELRLQIVADLDDRDRYDMAWVPTIFIPSAAVFAALPRLLAALRRGGWLVLGGVRYEGDEFSDAITGWRVIRDGGTAAPADDLIERLREAGFDDVRRLPVPPGAPAVIGARLVWPRRASRTARFSEALRRSFPHWITPTSSSSVAMTRTSS